MDDRSSPSIAGICQRGVVLEPIAPGVSITEVDRTVKHRESSFRLALVHPMAYQIAVHGNCACNELVALRNRHLVQRGQQFDPLFYRQWMGRWSPSIPVVPLSPIDFCLQYTGAKRRLYLEACNNLYEWKPNISLMIKVEKQPLEKVRHKPPRAIQFRCRQYNILLGRWLRPLEDEFYSDYWARAGLPSPIAKFMNMKQRAERLRGMWDSFQDPVAVLLDHSKFDSSIRVEHLQTEHAWIRKCADVGYLLDCQLVNKGAGSGYKYRVRGTRMSGDYNTSLGNCYINYNLLVGFLEYSNIRAEILLDGDDSVLVMERGDAGAMRLDYWPLMGFNTDVAIVTEFERIDFCQCRPCYTVHGWVLTRNPQRLISHMQGIVKPFTGRMVQRWLAGVAEAEIACGSGVPIHQSLALQCRRDVTPYLDDDLLRRKQLGFATKSAVVTDEARWSYYRAWGVCPIMQQRIEAVSCNFINNDFATTTTEYLRFFCLAPGPHGGWQAGWADGATILDTESSPLSGAARADARVAAGQPRPRTTDDGKPTEGKKTSRWRPWPRARRKAHSERNPGRSLATGGRGELWKCAGYYYMQGY